MAAIVLGGCTYNLKPLSESDIDRCRERIKLRRPNPFDLVRPELPHVAPEDRKLLYDMAFAQAKEDTRRPVSAQELAEWFDSRDGVIYTTWLSLRREYIAGFDTLEKVEQAVEREQEQRPILLELLAARDAAHSALPPAEPEQASV